MPKCGMVVEEWLACGLQKISHVNRSEYKHNQIYKLCQLLGRSTSSSLHKQIFIFDLPAAGLESGIAAAHSINIEESEWLKEIMNVHCWPLKISSSICKKPLKQSFDDGLSRGSRGWLYFESSSDCELL
jgi:hypothetical protein